MAKLVGDAGDERPLGPDHHEVDAERGREPEQAFGVVGTDRMAVPERSDPRITRCGVELGQQGALDEPPGEGMLARA